MMPALEPKTRTFRKRHPLAISLYEARMLDILRSGEGPFSVDEILRRMHGREVYHGDPKVVAVMVCRIRKSLKDLGRDHEIEIRNWFARGYLIPLHSRTLLEAILGPVPEPAPAELATTAGLSR